MIQLKKVHIKNVRGIRKLDLSPDGRSYAIQGENGTGKSGVVDAIEFALTGTISRLAGGGASDVSLAKHGPHIDYVDKPKLQPFEHTTTVVMPPTLTPRQIFPAVIQCSPSDRLQ